jgi:hypothetical protein
MSFSASKPPHLAMIDLAKFCTDEDKYDLTNE